MIETFYLLFITLQWPKVPVIQNLDKILYNEGEKEIKVRKDHVSKRDINPHARQTLLKEEGEKTPKHINNNN